MDGGGSGRSDWIEEEGGKRKEIRWREGREI